MFRLKYLISKFLYYFQSKADVKKLVCFVTHNSTKGWILDAKCQRLSKNMQLETILEYSDKFKHLPKTTGYFFAHYKYFAKALKYSPNCWNARNIVMFTHPNWTKAFPKNEMIWVLKKAYRVICLNSQIVEELVKLGLDREKLLVYHMASNPEMFTSHERGSGIIGLSMAFYERKNPQLLLDIIKKMPERKFLLLGKSWDKWDKFPELESLSNFEYYNDIPYENYPSVYQQMDVFLSTSSLEGGPVPLLEAMLCNVVPVVSNTGFCADIVKNGKNGYVFNTDASADEVIKLINLAFEITVDVRKDVVNYSWQNFGAKLDGLFTN